MTILNATLPLTGDVDANFRNKRGSYEKGLSAKIGKKPRSPLFSIKSEI